MRDVTNLAARMFCTQQQSVPLAMQRCPERAQPTRIWGWGGGDKTRMIVVSCVAYLERPNLSHPTHIYATGRLLQGHPENIEEIKKK